MTLRRAACAAILALWSAACDHTPAGSFTPPDRGPLSGDNPRQVTFTPGSDLRPSWLPDGSGFFYTRERLDRSDRDRCFGLLPAQGGELRREVCDGTVAGLDSITNFQSAAVTTDGRFAYVRASAPLVPQSIAPLKHEVRVGTLAVPAGTAVRTLPYTVSQHVHAEAAWLQWRSSSELVYLGQGIEYQAACSSCPIDTVAVGLDVVRLDVTTGLTAIITGTDSATSVALVNSDSIYFTLPNDGQVRRRLIDNPTTAIAHDFGPAANARDITVQAGRLVAVTGPGLLRLVQLATGAETVLSAGLVFFKRPALAPDGRRLVVEGYPYHVDTIRVNGTIVAINTVVSTLGDLWVFDLP